ncbi:MAG: hypothetical protein ACJ78R_00175 [Gemmatimonadaceae bacterium]
MLEGARTATLTIAAAAALFAVSGAARAQQAASSTPAVASGPAVNDIAPDFTLVGADRYGLLKNSVRLADYRGRTVVLAFFFQARTKG